MFRKVLVANRGAVARRIVVALRDVGATAVAVYSEPDVDGPWVTEADEAHPLSGYLAKDTYLNEDALLDVARRAGVDALHPGYGFLAESPGFARRVREAGLTFVGPAPQWIEAMGHKTRARELMSAAGIPIAAGCGVLGGVDEALQMAAQIGYPVLIKPAAGGGGIGMFKAESPGQVRSMFSHASLGAAQAFDSAELYLERWIERPRHVEWQILADAGGNVGHLFERDCSIQRRHQKVVEEAPAVGIHRAELDAMAERIVTTLAHLGYDNIGTVEMLRDAEGEYAFLEMNTRLQVEHGVTEVATGVDIVAAQLRLAAGAQLAEVLPEEPVLERCAIEARIYAEDARRFLPSPGRLDVFRAPDMRYVRVDAGYAEGMQVTPYYDPLLAKVIAHGSTRPQAIGRLLIALKAFEIQGVEHNIPAIQALLSHDAYLSGGVHTGLLGEVVNVEG